MKILLDYVFPISVITPTPAASTAFLKQACLVVNPKSGQEANVGTIYECVSMSEVAARTDNANAQQLFDAGMTKVYILLADHLDLTEALDTAENEEASEFFTLIISDDFNDADIEASQAALTVNGDLTFTAVEAGIGGNEITVALVNSDSVTAGDEVVTVDGKDIVITIDSGVSTATQIKAKFDASSAAVALASCTIVSGQGGEAQAAAAEDSLEGGDGLALGGFEGVVGLQSQDDEVCEDQAVISNRVAFFSNVTNKAKNMCYAFGSLLGNLSNWLNQQYIEMPFDDGVNQLGQALSLFNDRVSFVMQDDEFGKRLGLFAAGGRAIVAPYILKNLRIDLQSRALQWISQNQPDYTIAEASLLEKTLQKDVIDEKYIARGWITSGSVKISVTAGSNFTALGEIEVPTPKALWRVESEMTETV
jgi:hypothetical protein